jgi:hypothetical protein
MSSFTVEDPETFDNCIDFAIGSADNSGFGGLAYFADMLNAYDFCEENGGCPCETLEPVIIPG